MIKLVYDPVLKKPGCVLLQAAYGCNHNCEAFRLFDTKDWLLSPTPDMAVMQGDFELWQKVAKITSENSLKK